MKAGGGRGPGIRGGGSGGVLAGFDACLPPACAFPHADRCPAQAGIRQRCRIDRFRRHSAFRICLGPRGTPGERLPLRQELLREGDVRTPTGGIRPDTAHTAGSLFTRAVSTWAGWCRPGPSGVGLPGTARTLPPDSGIFALDMTYDISYISTIKYVMITKPGRPVRRPGRQEGGVM